MHTLALPKSVLCIELGPQWPLAHYELAYLIKKKLWDPCCLSSAIQMTFAVVEITAISLLCNVLCREGVRSNVVYLGGFSMRG